MVADMLDVDSSAQNYLVRAKPDNGEIVSQTTLSKTKRAAVYVPAPYPTSINLTMLRYHVEHRVHQVYLVCRLNIEEYALRINFS